MSITPQLRIAPGTEWLPDAEQPLIIAGPCSAETLEQVMATARQVAKIPGVTVFRAGIWKPRTRPNGFEGIGVEGLQWLRQVKEETGLKTAIEVANATHVYEALKHGVDILWIGARTTVNPFSVQEIANALRGVDVPVWVKNPVNPDLNLWIGALERLSDAGVQRLGAIHRGFSTYNKNGYRNPPMWNLAIDLMAKVPDLPVICDPSHICGNRELIHKVSQRAFDLAMNGVMIETHIDPDNALSDANQQLTPARLAEILGELQFRRPGGDLSDPEAVLADMRHEIDETDQELLEIMRRRTEIVARIGKLKRDHHMTILQVSRWKQLLEDRLQRGNRIGLEEDFVEDIFRVIHERSIKMQSEVMNQ
ncbi:MAG TPA: chorismate mutase [Calditrichia bacterium]|nr:chorismate mutase [Calditrichia bacterium]